MAVSLRGTHGTSPANFSTSGTIAPVSWPLCSLMATNFLLSWMYSSMIERAVSLTTNWLSFNHLSSSALLVDWSTT